MALAGLYRVIQDVAGNIVTGVLGTVTLSGTSTLASLFSDAAGTVPLPNPTTNNAEFGSFSLFVGAGMYDMQFVKSGFIFETQRNITLRDPASGVTAITGTANQVLVSPVGGVGAVTLALPQDHAPDSNVQYGRLGINEPAGATATRLRVNGDAALTGNIGINVSPGAGFVLSVNGNTQHFGGTFTNTGTINQTGNTILGGLVAIGSGIAAGFSLSVNGPTQFFGGDLTHTGVINAASLNTSGGEMVIGHAGIGGAIVSSTRLTLSYIKGTDFGLVFKTLGADGGATNPVTFSNVAGGTVGTIGTTVAATSYNTSSDARLKHAVTNLTGELALIQALRPVSFLWNADDSPGVGFLAHEVAAAVAGVISGEPDGLEPDGSIRPQVIDYSKLVPWLVGALKTLVQRLEVVEDAVGV